MREVYQYTFGANVSLEDVESSLLLAIFAVESLHGESQARLDVHQLLDDKLRSVAIDASTEVGQDLNRLFTGFLRREFDETAFRVKRLDSPVVPQPAPAGA